MQSGTLWKAEAPGIAHTWAGAGTLSRCPREDPPGPGGGESEGTGALSSEGHTDSSPRGEGWGPKMGVTMALVAPQQETAGREPATWGAEAGRPPGHSGPWGRAVPPGRGNDGVRDSRSVSLWQQALSTLRGRRHGRASRPLWVPWAGLPSPVGAMGRPPVLCGCHRAPVVPGTPVQSRSLPTARGRVQTSPRARSPWPPGPARAPRTARPRASFPAPLRCPRPSPSGPGHPLRPSAPQLPGPCPPRRAGSSAPDRGL